ncbi:orotidine-5'-phosphate decarboxylase [bacterium]|nr:orotidine-5'-phosphate decarboxylase [bacterium]
MNDTFNNRLTAAIEAKGSRVCVGLDPRYARLPEELRRSVEERVGEAHIIARAEVYRLFCRGIVEAVAPYAAAVKPQFAFFEQAGPAALAALVDVIAYARKRGLLVIGDAKRGDIGSTAEAYAGAFFSPEAPWPVDALTVNPYLGRDSVEPFLETAAANYRGVYLLARTSNPGAVDVQDLELKTGGPVWRGVAGLIAGWSGSYPGVVGAVFGATYPAELREGLDILAGVPLLLPGYGAQGATADDISFALTGANLVSSSRGIIFAFERSGGDWREAAAEAAQKMRDELNAVSAD